MPIITIHKFKFEICTIHELGGSFLYCCPLANSGLFSLSLFLVLLPSLLGSRYSGVAGGGVGRGSVRWR